jgi:hypothetical protein
MFIDAKTQAHTCAVAAFLQQHAHSISHVAVAHTRYKTFERTDFGMQRAVESAKQDCRHFRNCFNAALYGRRARRKPLLYRPLVIATLEGSLINSDRDLTLHYNFAFGNLPADLTDAEFAHKLRSCWIANAGQRNDIWYENVTGETARACGWLNYSMKEATDKGNVAVWDFENTQIPYAAFDAG